MRAPYIVGILLGLSGCSSSPGESANERPGSAPTNNDAFFALLNLSHASYVPLSAPQMADEAAIIATGRFIDATEGLTVRRKFAKAHPDMPTVVVTLEVETAIKGTKPGDHVYLQFVHGGAVPASAYASRLSGEPVTVFLSPADWMESDAVEYVDVGKGHPEGSKLYRLRTPQALLTARDGKLWQPTAPEESVQLFTSGMDSLTDIDVWYDEGAAATAAGPADVADTSASE